MPTKTDAILLDVGGVLALPRHEPIVRACRALGVEVDVDRIDEAHYAGVRGIDTSAEMDFDAYVRAYARTLGVADHRSALWRLQDAFRAPRLWRRRIEASVVALREIAALGLPLAIVSNSDGSVERSLLELEVCQVGEGSGVEVRIIVDSAVVGAEKPAPRIFQHALEALGVEPSRSIYVGDSIRFDVRGALAAGIRPVLFDPFDHARDLGLEYPRIRELRELLALV